MHVAAGGLPSRRETGALIVVWTSEPALLGKRFSLDAPLVLIGRGAHCDVILRDSYVAPEHARLELRGAARWIIDLGSPSGTFVDDRFLEGGRERALEPGARITLGRTAFEYLSGADLQAQYHEAVYRITLSDGLTEAANRRYLMQVLEEEIAGAHRRAAPLSLIALDVDRMKAINDDFGHLTGDFVLRRLGKSIPLEIPPDEKAVFARWGGDEFLILVPHREGDFAHALAEQLRANIESSTYGYRDASVPVTISAGVSCLSTSTRTDVDLIRRAEEHLQEAKRAGGNRVVGSVG